MSALPPKADMPMDQGALMLLLSPDQLAVHAFEVMPQRSRKIIFKLRFP
jgi:hypothetical protein